MKLSWKTTVDGNKIRFEILEQENVPGSFFTVNGVDIVVSYHPVFPLVNAGDVKRIFLRGNSAETYDVAECFSLLNPTEIKRQIDETLMEFVRIYRDKKVSFEIKTVHMKDVSYVLTRVNKNKIKENGWNGQFFDPIFTASNGIEIFNSLEQPNLEIVGFSKDRVHLSRKESGGKLDVQEFTRSHDADIFALNIETALKELSDHYATKSG